MNADAASILGIFFGLSEAGLSLFKRAKQGEAQSADRGSLSLLWIVIFLSVALAYTLRGAVPAAAFGSSATRDAAGIPVFVAGLAIRWYAIVYLGRFFTVNVAIAADHRLIDTGPYRVVRHPSYTGALMMFLGVGLCLGNWASLAAIMVPTFTVFLRRMRVEEDALAHALGPRYRDYMRRTKRLVPALY